MKPKSTRLYEYQIVARMSSVCGWTIPAESLVEARRLTEEAGPDYAGMDFDEPDGFEICTVKPTKVNKRGAHK